MATHSTHIRRIIKAPRSRVYQALIDAKAIAAWKFHDDMAITVHEFEGRQGGYFRVSLTYHNGSAKGKTTAHTDTYSGRFTTLVPYEKVVEEEAFETADPHLQGKMTATDVDGGTLVDALHEGVPAGIAATDNELGWQMALSKLATLVEDQ